MTRIALTVEDGTVHLSDGRSLPLLVAAERLAGQRVWVEDIHRIPHALQDIRLSDALTLAQVLGITAPTGSAEDIAAWVDDNLDALQDEDTYEDARLAVDQQRSWWRVLARGLRIDRDAVANAYAEASYRRRLTTLRLGTDMLFDDNARGFLDQHNIRIHRPTDPDDAPTTVSWRHWHHAEVPDESRDAWDAFRAARQEITTFRKLDEIRTASRTGRVWTRWQVSGATTGRMSSSAIPLQNVPKALRHLFLADPGHVLIQCDLDRAEPSVAAWLSGDGQLAADLRDGDVYQSLADRLGIERPQAKIVLLSLLYGKGIRALAYDLEVTRRDAQGIKDGILDAYPDLARWMKRTTRHAERGRGVTTAFGRHIPLHPDDAYRAVNYAAQGTAAGVLLGMIDSIIQHPLLGEDALWLAVHDEVLLQVPEADDYDDMLSAFKECMSFEADGITITGTPTILGERWGQ